LEKLSHAEKDLWTVKYSSIICFSSQIVPVSLTKSAKKEAEDWARQTKRTLVMELIKQRKHTWISRPKRQRSDDQPVLPAEDNGGLCYEEHNGVIEIGLDAKIVPTYSFEEIRNQIEEKWKEEIKTKMADIHQRKSAEQDELQKKLDSVQLAAEKEKDMLQKEHDDHMYSLNKMNELLKKMLINEKSSENENQPCEIDVAFWKSEFECPICFEEMKPPMRIWQCVDGHPVCEGCRKKLDSKGCPSCNRSVEGRNIALEKMARSLYGDK